MCLCACLKPYVRDIRDAKLKVLRQVNRVDPAKDVVAGQYVAGGRVQFGGGGVRLYHSLFHSHAYAPPFTCLNSKRGE